MTTAVSRFATTWLPVLAWAAAIFAFSSIPSLATDLGTWDLVLRKGAHLFEFAVLGFLLARVLLLPAAFAAGVAYAVTDEIHQLFVPGRAGSPADVGIDAVGVLLGILVFRRLER